MNTLVYIGFLNTLPLIVFDIAGSDTPMWVQPTEEQLNFVKAQSPAFRRN